MRIGQETVGINSTSGMSSRSQNRRTRSLLFAAAGIVLATTTVRGQTTINWSGTVNNSWGEPGNWAGGVVPDSTKVADFLNSSSNTNITLGGTNQNIGAIVFEGSNSPYVIGITPGDMLTIANNNANGNDAVGAIAIPSSDTNPQEIDAAISFTNTGPIISAAAQTLTLGSSSSPATITLPSTGTTKFGVQVSNAATIVFNDAISGFVGTANSGGGLNITSTNKNNATVVFNNPNSTYSGITNLGNGDVTAGDGTFNVQIGCNSVTDSMTGALVSGPFGISTIVSTSTLSNPVQAVGADRTVANPFQFVTGCTFGVTSTPQNLTFTGPVTFTGTQGRTATDNMAGATLTFGASPNSTTFTLNSANSANNMAFNTVSGSTLVLNDTLQDATGKSNTISFSSVNNTSGTVIIAGSNTYSGATTFNSKVVCEIGSDSSADGTTGPFGAGAITFSAATSPTLEALGANRTVANALKLTNGLAVANATTPFNLSLTGPITTTTTGQTLAVNIPGHSLTLGASPNSTTFALGTSATVFNTSSSSTLVLNDTLTNASGQSSAISFGSISSSSGTIVVAGSNTYSGGTTFGSSGTQPAVEIKSDSSADGTMGPFGSGAVTFNSSLPAILEPVSGDRTVANSLVLSTHGFFTTTFGTTLHSLTLSGPITISGIPISTNNFVSGALLNLGSSPGSSTITASGGLFAIQGQNPTGDVTNVYDNVIDGASPTALEVQGGGTSGTGIGVMNLLGNNNNYSGGTTIKAHGTLTTNTNFSNGSLTLINTLVVSGVTYPGPATAVVSAQATPGATAGVTVIPSLSIDSGSATPTSKFDITNNGLILSSTGTTSFAQIRGYIIGGASNSFTGAGITSSTAAAVAISSSTHKTAIGYANASDLMLTAGSQFLGKMLTDNSAVLVRYTLAGDANLDGIVNALDFNALATNYGVPTGNGNWVQGDFNYDGGVDSTDFGYIAANFGSNVATTGAATPDAQSMDSLGTLVPEPMTLLPAMIGMGVMSRWRKRV